jgi:hypothetical protein
MADHHPYLVICARPVFGNSSAPGFAGGGAPLRPEHQVLQRLTPVLAGWPHNRTSPRGIPRDWLKFDEPNINRA